MKHLRLLLSAVLCLGAGHALAAPEGALYKPVFPPGSGMARVFNAGAPVAAGQARFGDRALGALGSGELSVYQPVVAGKRAVSCGRKTYTLAIRESAFQTVVCGGRHEGLVVVDPTPVHINKTFIILYNLRDAAPARLAAAGGKLTVIDAVAPQKTGSREINPVRVELSIYEGATPVFRLGEVPLAPEKIYSLFVVEEGGETRAWLRESQLNAEI
ncbi:MAG: alginate o-acetyltransferase AlgF [Moraxellaceae bacterium]|jgi:alginate O-acetyltransferase complex protein AlgF|nr:alginate o-acetyltransferase AlgF [Moraxellaceae bacterium]